MRDVGTLLEALPYIREFHGKTVVIKYGGAAMERDELKDEFARDVVLLKYVGMNPIVVHGGGPEITRYMERLGLEVKFDEQGRRVSDAQTVELAKMVLIGKLTNEIVGNLNRHAEAFKRQGETDEARGLAAIGLCGDDGALFEVRSRGEDEGEPSLGLVGKIGPGDVNVVVLNDVAEDFIPVVASVGADRDGVSHNVNADEVAGAIAAAVGAYKIFFLTDVVGLLEDADDPETRVQRCTSGAIGEKLAGGKVGGGMVPKLEACKLALDHGVSAAHIVDGREPHSLLVELFTDAGIGTMIVAAD